MTMRFLLRSATRSRCAAVFALAVIVLAACGDDGDGDTADKSAPASDQSAARRGAGGEAGAVDDATGGRGEVPLSIEFAAGSDRANVQGTGRCSHAPEASIYGTPASLWQIQDSNADELRYANLTVWRPKSGDADQFSMSVNTGGSDHRISTVKGGEIVGSGSVTFQQAGEGGRFEIVGKDAEGRSVRATFHCERFAAHIAEGG